MAIEVEQRGDTTCIKIVDEMTIYTAAEHKVALGTHLQGGRDIEVDLAEVSEIDSAGLQLLMMLKAECKHAAKTIHYVHHSQPVIEVLELLSLDFGDPIILPKEWHTA